MCAELDRADRCRSSEPVKRTIHGQKEPIHWYDNSDPKRVASDSIVESGVEDSD